MKNKITNLIVIIFMVIFGVGSTILLYSIIVSNGIYPSGSDTMSHVYRGDLLLKSLSGGSGYPVYDRFWYNGTEPMRYNMPLSAFLFALCELLAGADVFKGYVFFVLAIYLLGTLVFTLIGIWKKRVCIGFTLGVIWFFLPNNIYTLFVEGELSRSVCFLLLPLLLYGIYEYLEDGRVRNLIIFAISLILLIFTNLEFSGMTVITLVVFLVFYRLYHKNRRRIIKVIAIMPLSFLCSGIVLYPYLKGSVAVENEEHARHFFQNLLISINPMYRINSSNEVTYFGLSLLLVAVLGAMASNKRTAPGFIVSIIILLLSTVTAYPVIQIIPGSELLLMLRFFTLAMAFIMMGLLYWEKLKRWVFICFILLIFADSFPSLRWVFGKENYETPQHRLTQLYEKSFIKEAKELCKQRIALFDLSSLGAEGAFLISDFGEPCMSVFGSGWKYSVTSDNTKQLNSAMCDEYFDYMFDRCIEYGADTIIIQKAQAVYGERTLVKLDRAAERLGYDIIDENDEYMLYHLNVDGTYGTVATYDGIGIGYSSKSLSLAFPNIKETGDGCLDHYSYDYLKQFKTVYLAGFSYDDRETAQELVMKLSENGVRVVILADGMPEDPETRSKTFLGVTCNIIQFENGYPILYTRDFGEMDCDLFPRGYSKWITYYLNGLKENLGTISDNSVELAFFGTGQNKNICYIALNIPFYYYLTKDANAEKLMNWVMGMDSGMLPERTIYPIGIEYKKNGVIIDSGVDYINTGIAYHEIFISPDNIYVDNNFLVVEKGRTEIQYTYPYLNEGLIMSVLGLLLTVAFFVYVDRSNRRDRETVKKEADDILGSCL